MMFVSGSFSTRSRNNNIDHHFSKSFCISKNKRIFNSGMKEKVYCNCINVHICCSILRAKNHLFLSSKSQPI